jgi:hypothetical protein
MKEETKMNKYEVWSEGFRATGEHGTAYCHGTVTADTFENGVIKLIGNQLDKDEKQPDGYSRRYSGRLSVWACRIFDNEKEARESFG